MTLSQSSNSAPDLGATPRRDRRSSERVALQLKGRYLIDGYGDHELLTANISCDGAFMRSADPPPVGRIMICYLDAVGRIAAEVVRTEPEGFAVRFHTSALKREKLGDRLNWLVSVGTADLPDGREHVRGNQTGQAVVILPDGSALPCNLTDISIAGAAFEALGTPPFVGERVHTGGLIAEVVRVEERHFAVRFLRGAEAASGE